ncbi:MAG TPA: hypothetical protein VKT73_08265 [Xanthobacteraceae bacterium]|nr:hypothetical protein [Xanthobacteraceae bacterium]
MTILSGRCHCGGVEVSFETAQSPQAIEVRACRCTFCRRHGAKTVTDADGRLVISAQAGTLNRYRFGLRTADFLLCRHCGVYIAAIIADGGEERATLNVAGTMIEGLWDRAATPIDLDHEDAATRRVRRQRSWTPATVVSHVARRSG